MLDSLAGQAPHSIFKTKSPLFYGMALALAKPLIKYDLVAVWSSLCFYYYPNSVLLLISFFAPKAGKKELLIYLYCTVVDQLEQKSCF